MDGCSTNCTFEPTGVDVPSKIFCVSLEGINPILSLTEDPTLIELKFTKSVLVSELYQNNTKIAVLETDTAKYNWTLLK